MQIPKPIIEEKPPCSDLLSIVLFINLQDDRFKVVAEN